MYADEDMDLAVCDCSHERGTSFWSGQLGAARRDDGALTGLDRSRPARKRAVVWRRRQLRESPPADRVPARGLSLWWPLSEPEVRPCRCTCARAREPGLMSYGEQVPEEGVRPDRHHQDGQEGLWRPRARRHDRVSACSTRRARAARLRRGGAGTRSCTSTSAR